jgi:hypothetical protein
MPCSAYHSALAARGAHPEPSSAIGLPPLSDITSAKVSPPSPDCVGSTTACMAAAQTAASTALPPSRSTSIAARVAMGCEVATMPSRPNASERPPCSKSRKA